MERIVRSRNKDITVKNWEFFLQPQLKEKLSRGESNYVVTLDHAFTALSELNVSLNYAYNGIRYFIRGNLAARKNGVETALKGDS